MGRRVNGLGNRKGRNEVGRKVPMERLDYHEGLSLNQVKVVLRECGLGGSFDKFDEWMRGQTCPFVKRYDEKGGVVDAIGIYEYDLFRWIANQKKGTPLIWD